MDKCINTGCRDKVEGHNKTLYGSDGLGGVSGEIKQKVDKVTYWKIISVFGCVLIYAFYTLIMGIESRADDKEFKDYKKEHTKCDKEHAKTLAETNTNIKLVSQQLGTLTQLSLENKKDTKRWRQDTESRLRSLEKELK